MNANNSYKEIALALKEWKFDQACQKHESMLEHTHEFFSEYINLLADFGKLDEIYNKFDQFGFLFVENIKADPKQKHPEALSFCLEFIKQKFIPSKYSLIGTDNNSKLLYLTNKEDKKELALYIAQNAAAIINNHSTAQDNMILNFAINGLISAKVLSSELGIKIVTAFIENKNINSWRKRYVLSSLLRYFYSCEDYSFFKLKEQHYNHLQKISFQLNSFFNEDGAKKLYHQFNNFIISTNNTHIKYTKSHKPKVAVCISGMFRGSSLAIESIKKNVADPLNADIFIHSWDQWQPWPGICGGAPDSWVWRLFGGDGKKLCPNFLKSFNDFKKYFPMAASVIENPVFSEFTTSFMKSLLSPISYKIDNESDFLNSLVTPPDSFSSRGNYNQAKMFYGIYESTALMLQHERKNNFEYDYVIRARPDCAIKEKLTHTFLDSLQFNELATDMVLDCGPLDQFYISRRDVHIKVANLWKASISSGSLSPFKDFPKYDAHALLFLWIAVNNIIPVSPPVTRHLALATSNLTPPKELYNALEHDLHNDAKDLIENAAVRDFISHIIGSKK
ncbi:hypothetical protein NQ261_23670 [Escherichia coli]|nr:hypothetical protein [Escherichia coli]